MSSPLADRIRPIILDDVVGQHHLLDEGKPLRKLIENGQVPNLIFYGPPGTGKTTIAKIIAKATNKSLRKLNGTTANTADIKEIVAEIGTFSATNGILLYLDEIQYFNKKQQQTLLEFLENGDITLIASTTENPYFYIYSAILSRSTVFEFKTVKNIDIEKALLRAVTFLELEYKISIDITKESISKIANRSLGDVRKAVNILEACFFSSQTQNKVINISEEVVDNFMPNAVFRYDKDSDEHYDTISAFQKAMRGSDADAALHYLARLIQAGDLISICRRLLVCACEDVGLAYPQIIPIVKSCTDIAMQVGFPEARIPLADAVVLVCNAPKSNSAYCAIDMAIADINKGFNMEIPRQLQNKHFDGDEVKNKGQFYKYPHNFPNHWIKQTYLPKSLEGHEYYHFGDNKTEQAFKFYWDKIKN